MSDRLTHENVAAVIVTYGMRFDYLNAVVHGILENGVCRVLIVDNGSPDDNRTKIEALCASHPSQVLCLRLAYNTGSAGGFGEGIAAAGRIDGVKFVWLFDDDNRPVRDAFEKLQSAYNYLGDDAKVALVSLRPGREPYSEAARNGKALAIRAGTFMDFTLSEHLKNRFAYLGRFLRSGASSKRNLADEFPRTPICLIQLAPYGGLLFHTQWLAEIGLPKKELYLYSDDHLYSLLMQKHGGRLYLCSESRLDELEPSWPGRKSHIPLLMRPETDETKIYCLVRNRVYLESQLVQHPWLYRASMCCFFLFTIGEALLFGAGLRRTIKRTRLLRAAIYAGRHECFEIDKTGRPVISKRVS